ncbi:MAG: LysM peptidoglycan-binding domain-containing protein [Bacteroidales bacterium]
MRTIFISLLSLFLIAGSSYAQTSPQVAVSTEKIKENGVVKYVHHVKKSETLYSISKAYGVSVETIINHNPNLKSGLQGGMIVFIPTANPAESQQGKTKSAQKRTGENKSEKTNNNLGNYKQYTAKWYENADDVAARFNVSVTTLMALNNLTTKELAKRQILLIPDSNYTAASVKEVVAQNQAETSNNRTQDYSATKNQTNTTIAQQATAQEEKKTVIAATKLQPATYNDTPRTNKEEAVRVSMILPLNSRDSTGISFNFMDFYAGSLLAINKLKEQGINMELNLFDQTMYSSVKNLAATGKLNNSQMIIGPIKGYNIEEIIPFSVQNHIPVISPMDPVAEQYIAGSPYLVQVPTQTNAQTENIVQQLYRDYEREGRNANIILCHETGKDTSAFRIIKSSLDHLGLNYETVSYGILEGRNMLTRISSLLNHSKKNLVIVPSNSEAFVSDFVRNLSLCMTAESKENSISLYGLPKWRNFETIEPDYFHKMNLHLSLPYYIDYSNDQVKDFILKFRALYNAEPSPYAFQGYDITKYFIQLLHEYGKDFLYSPEMKNGKMLQSDYNFSREHTNGGLQNIATRNVGYQADYSIKTL